MPYRPDQLFDLVADVGKYPEFLPWCAGAHVRTHNQHELVADLVIRFGPFRYLNNQWVFTSTPGGTRVDFWVDFEFRNRLLQAAIGVVFAEAVKRMVSAFLKRARDVYGPAPAAHIAGQGTTPAAQSR